MIRCVDWTARPVSSRLLTLFRRRPACVVTENSEDVDRRREDEACMRRPRAATCTWAATAAETLLFVRQEAFDRTPGAGGNRPTDPRCRRKSSRTKACAQVHGTVSCAMRGESAAFSYLDNSPIMLVVVAIICISVVSP